MKRNEYFDFLKGIAILMVIGIHTFIGGGFSSWHEYLNTGVRQILNCAVPVFIACSGFFLAKKSLKNKEEIRSFYRKQISRVYLPCFLWSLPWFSSFIIGGNDPKTGILNLVFCGFSVFYFVILMIQYYLLLPVIQVVKNRAGGGTISRFINMQSGLCGSCDVCNSYKEYSGSSYPICGTFSIMDCILCYGCSIGGKR